MLEMDKIKSNLEDICIKDVWAEIGGTPTKEERQNYIADIYKWAGRISLSQLDEHFESGLGENTSFLSNSIWPFVVGYALLARYGLKEEEYIQWAEEFEDKLVTYKLLLIIGIERSDLKKAVQEKEENEKKSFQETGAVNKKIQDKYEYLLGILQKEPLYIAQDASGEIPFLGEKLHISEEMKRVAKILMKTDEAKAFAEEVFCVSLTKDVHPTVNATII